MLGATLRSRSACLGREARTGDATKVPYDEFTVYRIS